MHSCLMVHRASWPPKRAKGANDRDVPSVLLRWDAQQGYAERISQSSHWADSRSLARIVDASSEIPWGARCLLQSPAPAFAPSRGALFWDECNRSSTVLRYRQPQDRTRVLVAIRPTISNAGK